MALTIPTVSIDDLRAFHATHFPHAVLPDEYLHGTEAAAAQDQAESFEDCYDVEEEDLGYYPDGAKRTLTDEQIAMFRHSEIQEILRMRRLQREDGECTEGEHASVNLAPDHEPPGTISATISTGNTAAINTGDQKHTRSGQMEKPKVQQWATSSARTKRKNKRNRDKYQAKKRADKEKHQGPYGKGNGDESDEWDPWHQANGPDAQKEDALDLDY